MHLYHSQAAHTQAFGTHQSDMALAARRQKPERQGTVHPSQLPSTEQVPYYRNHSLEFLIQNQPSWQGGALIFHSHTVTNYKAAAGM